MSALKELDWQALQGRVFGFHSKDPLIMCHNHPSRPGFFQISVAYRSGSCCHDSFARVFPLWISPSSSQLRTQTSRCTLDLDGGEDPLQFLLWALSNSGDQEHGVAVHPVWPGQSGDCKEAVVCASGPRCVLRSGNHGIWHEKAAKPE